MKAYPARLSNDFTKVDLEGELGITAGSAAAELGCLVLLVELIEWAVPMFGNDPAAYGGLALVIAVLMAVCSLRDRLVPKQLGIRVDNLSRVLLDLLPFLAAFIAAVVLIGLAAGSIRVNTRFWSMLAVVPPWALLQQYMLLGFANYRFRVLLGKGTASTLATTGLFAALHLPNPVLTVVCGFGGYVWAREYERRPNLFANAITHTIASAFLANALPHWLLRNMVVGYNHFLR